MGGLYVSGRWHTKGHPVVYCTFNPATALLETLVHIEIDSEDRPERYQVLRIECSDSLSMELFEPLSLPTDWAQDISSTQAIGDRWLSEKRSVLLQVPCVLVSLCPCARDIECPGESAAPGSQFVEASGNV